jgi:hypothetical protein
MRYTLAIAALLLVLPSLVGAQIVSPILPVGEFEVGYAYVGIERPLSNEGIAKGYERTGGMATARYGLSQLASAWLDLALPLPTFDEEETYTIGGGIVALVWDSAPVRVTTSVFYEETVVRTRDHEPTRWWEQAVGWALLMEIDVAAGNHAATFWAGPSLTDLRVWTTTSRATWESDDRFGLTFGGRALFWRHWVSQAGATWVGGGLQSHLMIAYRL